MARQGTPACWARGRDPNGREAALSASSTRSSYRARAVATSGRYTRMTPQLGIPRAKGVDR